MPHVFNLRVASANSFAELHEALTGDPRLRQPVVQLAVHLESSDLGAALGPLTGPDLSLGLFLQRKDLHRALSVRLPYQALLNAFKEALQSGPDEVQRDLTQADAFDDLVQFVEGNDLGRRRMLDVVNALALAPRLETRIIQRAAHLTVLEFLQEADDQQWSEGDFFELLDAFVTWTEQQLAALPPARPSNVIALPVSRPRRASLEQAMEKLGIPDLAKWTVGMLQAQLSPYDASPKLSTLLQTNLPELDRQLKVFANRLAALRALPPEDVQRVANPALAALQEAAIAERARFIESYPLGLGMGTARLDYLAPTLAVQVLTRGSPPPGERVGARDFWRWPRAPQLSCSCGLPMCIHRIAVLDGLRHPWLVDEKAAQLLVQALRPPWSLVLDAIATVEPRKRCGVLSFEVGTDTVDLRFHEQGKRGPSAKGKRLTPEEVLPLVEGVDQRIAERFALADLSGASLEDRHLGDGLLLLEGHPRVRWQAEAEPSPVARAEGTVKVEETPEGFRFRFLVEGNELVVRSTPYRCTGGAVMLLRAADGRILVTLVSEQFLKLVTVTAQLGAELPREAVPRLVELLPALEQGSLVELPDGLRGEELTAAERVLVRVSTQGIALSLAIRVEPLEGGPVFIAGHGVSVSASFDGQRRTFARRRFEVELACANALAGTLGLDPMAASEPYTWQLDASDKHVETLRRLSQAGVPVEWLAPKVKFTGEAQLDRLSLEITRKKDWFGLEGEVTVDDRRVSLAALLEAARARRRFVKLGEGDFAQLSEAMLEALAPLAHLGAPGAATELTLGTAPLIEALAPQLEALNAAKEWTTLMTRLTEAKSATFEIPRGLKATLRDYQVEGFEWLSRLAQWGIGACLADDMGLGKTLQALALLLSRAKKGPALVVAPSSVLHNWRSEAEKFAPSLKLALFHEGDRALAELKAGDVLVVSWALLAREAVSFAQVKFSTVVLDEAHAIKNADTLRAKAAHRLQADFLVALSGTPIENHVGELWSLFRAVMPALLGSEESFRKRFGSGQKEALEALSKLVRPFVLRRTKSAVAKELPARTELEVVVPLSAEERALYDDVRLAALAELGDVTGDSKRFDVLAMLTRLRLTACHPKLVDAGWKGPTSKLTRLLELVKDLSSAGHRALVFSQFTKHLALVVEALRAEGLTFSYLDGQVPLAERARRVEVFQAGGGGDVFLISLKAGGTGLNLTAADYVIHLDPWWNPAVEDQASDRAHRIGQARPVTVYRLIAEGTIEQQILSLHRDKRELVDALLSGADTAGKLSTTQLAQLIRSS